MNMETLLEMEVFGQCLIKASAQRHHFKDMLVNSPSQFVLLYSFHLHSSFFWLMARCKSTADCVKATYDWLVFAKE